VPVLFRSYIVDGCVTSLCSGYVRFQYRLVWFIVEDDQFLVCRVSAHAYTAILHI